MQMFNIKRVNWPSFFVCLGISFCISVAASHDYLGLWIGICCLLMAWVISPEAEYKYTLPSLALLSLLLLILVNLFLSSPSGYPVAYFIVSYGLVGFIIFTAIEKKNIVSIYTILLVFFSLLSIWSLVQYVFSIGKFSSHGLSAGVIFANPNSYAAILNIILFPLVTLFLVRKNSKSSYMYFVVLLLFASLITTQSRGAWVAFIIGFLFLIFLLRFNNSCNLELLKKIVLGFIFTFVVVSGVKFAILSLPLSYNLNFETNMAEVLEDNFNSAVANKGKGSLTDRKELALIAWNNIKENMYFGIGYYNTIYYYYKDVEVSVYTKTHYIHNDYLQMWLELGLFGIIFIAGIVITVYWQGFHSFKNMLEEDRVWVIAILSGLTTVFIHALVSFVFYIPALICLVSGYFAILNNILKKYNNNFVINLESFSKVVNVIDIKIWIKRLLISILILVYLFSFVLAQISFRAGKTLLSEGEINHATKLFNIARHISPADVDNYLLEAAFWRNKAFIENNTESALRSDVLYQQLMFENKYDAESRLNRAILHRDGYMLLNKPASEKVIIGWLEEALRWRPHHNILQSEYLRTLKMYGRIKEARSLLARYLLKYPNSKSLARVREEIMN